MNTRTYTLTALTLGDTPEGAFGELLYRCQEALVSHDTVQVPHWRTGEPQTAHRVTLIAGVMRDTQAHGIACALGFVASIA